MERRVQLALAVQKVLQEQEVILDK
jgi:hypothetical protein